MLKEDDGAMFLLMEIADITDDDLLDGEAGVEEDKGLILIARRMEESRSVAFWHSEETDSLLHLQHQLHFPRHLLPWDMQTLSIYLFPPSHPVEQAIDLQSLHVFFMTWLVLQPKAC